MKIVSSACVLIITIAGFVVTLLRPSEALNNNLGKTPGMGWNSDYCVACVHPSLNEAKQSTLGGFQNEGFIKHIAHTMHTKVLSNGKTLQDLGYL